MAGRWDEKGGMVLSACRIRWRTLDWSFILFEATLAKYQNDELTTQGLEYK